MSVKEHSKRLSTKRFYAYKSHYFKVGWACLIFFTTLLIRKRFYLNDVDWMSLTDVKERVHRCNSLLKLSLNYLIRHVVWKQSTRDLKIMLLQFIYKFEYHKNILTWNLWIPCWWYSCYLIQSSTTTQLVFFQIDTFRNFT